MTYRQTLDYLYAQLPMFHRIGAAAYKANLDNTITICEFLGNPEKKFKSIHVAGTNGKGSTSHMLASILQSAGYKVGLYTSPHLKDFRERIRINGQMISEKHITGFVKEYKNDFEKIQPSFFEWSVGLAFDYFAKQKVDVAVIETGLGGRLDSTNVITPLLSVITNISYDHVNLLGDTLQKIAEEKAGIIKQFGITIIGEKQKTVRKVFEQKAKEKKSLLYFADDYFVIKNCRQKFVSGKLFMVCDVQIKNEKNIYLKNLLCELPGLYQQKNIKTALATIYLLDLLFPFEIPNAAIRNGLMKVSSQTGLRGRWQVISKKPLTIADTGHNEAGIKEVISQIKKTPHKNLHIVFGVVNDKDVSSILKVLPKKAEYYFCKANIPRALDTNELTAKAKIFKLKGNAYTSVKSALKSAKTKAKKGDLIFVGGSTFVVAEVL